MEAVAQYPFDATSPEELSFKKGKLLRVLNTEDDPNWCRAECDGREGLVPKNYIQMKECSWFAGSISRESAEAKLLKENYDGAFLVRRSESSPGDFSLSVKYQAGVQHFKVLRDGAGKYFLWIVKFESLNQLIEYHRTTSVSRGPTIILKDPNGAAPIDKDKKQSEKLVQAIFDFIPQANCPDEMPMKKGDIVVIIEETDKNWWTGRNKSNNKKGLFPANHVQKVN